MREILFRGKSLHDGEWLYGAYYKQEEYYGDPCDYHYIIFSKDELEDNMMLFEGVIPETVGQYTGLTVPSGKIFENDIVTAKFKSNGARYNFTVKYDNTKGSFVFDNGSVKVPFCDIRSVRIIGNIHDNPELLEVGA